MFTVADRNTSIDSAEDLIKSNLPIYGMINHKDLIWQEEIRDRYLAIDTFQACAVRLFKGDRIACIGNEYIVSLYVYENETIHISKNSLVSRASAYVFSQDSPLRLTLTRVLLKMEEGGLIHLLYLRRDWLKKAKNLEDTNTFEAFDIKQLIPTLSILFGGWAFAFIALSVEFIVYKLKRHTF